MKMRFAFILCALTFAARAQNSSPGRPDLLIADFEGPTYGAWKVTGTAFGTGPSHGTLPGEVPVSGFLGHGFANSFFGGDQATGTLTSPPFRIDRKYIACLIGGGCPPGVPSGRRVPGGQTCLNIVVDGRIVKIFNAAGGNNILTPEYLDVSPFVGKIAVIIIVDNCMAPWGHILVDQIVQTDNPYTPPPAALPVTTISPGYGLPTQASAVPAQSAFAPVQPSAEPA